MVHWLLTFLVLASAVQTGLGTPLFSENETSQRLSELVLNKLEWRSVGPAIMGGRIDDFAVLESDPRVIYTATASGGLKIVLLTGGDISQSRSSPHDVHHHGWQFHARHV